MFYRIYGKDLAYRTFAHYTVLGIYETVEEAKNSREQAGDVIFDETGTIVQNEDWLWDWEKADKNCHAQKCIINKQYLGNGKMI